MAQPCHRPVRLDAGADGDGPILEALGEFRVRLQAAIGRQIHARKTPILQFRPDDVMRSAERIDRILRDLHDEDGGSDREA